MEKETGKIQRPTYIYGSMDNMDDRKRLVQELPYVIAFLTSLGYTRSKGRALLAKQQAEISINNARIIAKDNKETQRMLERRRKQVADLFFDCFNFEYIDENGVWLPVKTDEQIVYEHKNKLGETDYTIKTTARKLIEASLIKAITDLKDDDGELKEQMHRKYDNYDLRQWYPLDASKPMKMFRLRLKWRL